MSLEREIKTRIEDSGRFAEGRLEQLQARVDKLEGAVAHLMAFIADHLRLTPEGINDENGLTDF